MEGLGGVITFGNHRAPTTPSTSRVKLTGQGTLSILGTVVQHIGAEVGSIEGDGLINLGSGKLTVGRNNRSTTFRGIISGDAATGTLTHIGTGTLNLTGANTYGGETVVYGGKLAVNNTTGSATGVSFVEVKGRRQSHRNRNNRRRCDIEKCHRDRTARRRWPLEMGRKLPPS